MEWYAALSTLEQIYLVCGATGTLIFLIRMVLMLIGVGHDHGYAGHLSGLNDVGDVGQGGGFDPVDANDIDQVDGLDQADDFEQGGAADDLDGDLEHGAAGHFASAHSASTSAPGHDFSSEFLQLFSIQTISTFVMMFGWFGMALQRGSGLGAIIALPASVAGGLGSVYLLGRTLRAMRKLEVSGTMNVWSAVTERGRVYVTIPEQGVGQVQVPVNEHLKVFDAVSEDGSRIPTGEQIQVVDVRNGKVMVVKPVAQIPEKT